jgi:imidazolonepropionase-like amidohydrolase
MILINADIYTQEERYGVVRNGSLRIQEGKIVGIGESPCQIGALPDEETVDLNGLRVYPGFVDAHTHLGMCEDSLTFEGDDLNEDTDPLTPHLRALDAINPADRCFQEAAMAGVTTVITGPGSANPIAGQMIAIKTYGNRIDDMIIAQPVAIKFALGENPKTVYHGRNQTPSTRMATAALIREQLNKAQRYLKEKQQAEDRPDDYDLPEYDEKCESLLPLLKGQIAAHFHAHRADDIFTAIRLSKEFSLNYVIVHGTEGHLIVDQLRRESARILSGPFLCDRSKPELQNQSPACPGILTQSGVCTAIITDHPVIPLQYLPVCAALAVREGMKPEDAIRAITINPAKICGISHRVGSIALGKDADISVFAEDPLDLMAKPRMVFSSGQRIL